MTPESNISSDLPDQNAFGFSGVASGDLGCSNPPKAVPQPTTQSADLDFDLIWPDAEDLLQTLMSTDSVNQWQMPLGTLPFSATPSTSEVTFGTPGSFEERPPSIGAIPTGGNHQAVQDVSKMVSNLVIRTEYLGFQEANLGSHPL